MGTAVTAYLKKKGANPFADAISRNDAGELTVDAGRVLSTLGVSAGSRQPVEIRDLVSAFGTGQVRVEDLRNYSRPYEYQVGGGDNDNRVTEVRRVLSGYPDQALRSAVEAFGIKEQGQKQAAQIAQEGRDKARQANFGAELASVNQKALAASEDNAYGQAGGTPDVVLSSDTDIDDAPAGQGVNARRRRAAFSGGGLRI